MSFSKTSGGRARVYQSIVRRYRRRRPTARADAPGIFEDPAPDWVWQLVEAILEHTGREPDHGRRWVEEALAWCEASADAPGRGAKLLELVTARLGPPPLFRLRRFLDGAWRAPLHAS